MNPGMCAVLISASTNRNHLCTKQSVFPMALCPQKGPVHCRLFLWYLLGSTVEVITALGLQIGLSNFPRLLFCCCFLLVLEAGTFQQATSDERMLPPTSIRKYAKI